MRDPINQLIKQKKFFLKAHGLSMLPTIYPDDVVYLKKVNFRNLRTNDIVMVKKRNRSFIHRVIYTDKYVVTKGDNNTSSDGKILPKQIIGKVYQIKRNGQVFNPQDINLLQSTLYFQEIVKVKKLFEKGGINFVFLKGLPVHLYYEGKHPSRIYADCDLLVNRNDYGKTEAVFHKLSYSKAKTEYSPIHKILKDKPTEFSFYKKVNNFLIVFDLHLEPVFLMNQLGRLNELYPQSLIDQMTRKMLATKKEIFIQGEKYLILDTYYLILYLALHFFHHNFRGIHRLEMIDKVIRKVIKIPSPGRSTAHTFQVFKTLSEKIRYFKVENFVYPAFLMLKKYFDTPLPRGFLNSIKPYNDKLSYITKNIIKTNVFDDEPRVQAGINRFKNIFFLSPEPIYRKIFVFLSPAVVYSICWVLYKKIKSYFVVTFAPNSLARSRK